MDRGMYAAVSGGLANARRLEVVANNLANVNTVGFKAQRLHSREQSFADTLASKLDKTPSRAEGDHERTPGVVHIDAVTDFSAGPVEYTGNPLNVALRDNNSFFAINTPAGVAYTRAGNFARDSEGTLITPDGFPVLSDGGPLTLPPGSANISSAGAVSVNGEEIGTLQVVRIDDPKQLKRTDAARFVAEGDAAPQAVPADLIPGSVELANVTVVQAMVEMISAQKSFEMYAKSARTINEMNEQTVRTTRLN